MSGWIIWWSTRFTSRCFGEEEKEILCGKCYRFHKLIWSDHGASSDGVIAAGGDTGTITLYSAEQILAAGKDPIIGQSEKHGGPVRGLDFNPFQVLNLLSCLQLKVAVNCIVLPSLYVKKMVWFCHMQKIYLHVCRLYSIAGLCNIYLLQIKITKVSCKERWTSKIQRFEFGFEIGWMTLLLGK